MLFLFFFLHFFSGNHRFQNSILPIKFETLGKEIVENAGLVDVGINIDGSTAADANFLHLLLQNASRPVVRKDFGVLPGLFGARSCLDLNLVSRSRKPLLNDLVLPWFSCWGKLRGILLHNLILRVLLDFLAYECQFEAGGNGRVCSFDLDILIFEWLLELPWLSSNWNLLDFISVVYGQLVHQRG